MNNQSTTDDIQQNLQPLINCALQIIDELHEKHTDYAKMLSIARAHAHGKAKSEVPYVFSTVCLRYFGVLRGVCKIQNRPYLASQEEAAVHEILKTYNYARSLLKTKDVPLW